MLGRHPAWSLLLPPSSILKTSLTHKMEVDSGVVTDPFAVSCRSGPKTQTSLFGCRPMQTAALNVSLTLASLHFLKLKWFQLLFFFPFLWYVDVHLCSGWLNLEGTFGRWSFFFFFKNRVVQRGRTEFSGNHVFVI